MLDLPQYLKKVNLKNYQNIMPRWQYISYSVVVVIEGMEKVHQGEGGGILGSRHYCVNIPIFGYLSNLCLEFLYDRNL